MGFTVSVILGIERLPIHGSRLFGVVTVQHMLSSKDYDIPVKELLIWMKYDKVLLSVQQMV